MRTDGNTENSTSRTLQNTWDSVSGLFGGGGGGSSYESPAPTTAANYRGTPWLDRMYAQDAQNNQFSAVPEGYMGELASQGGLAIDPNLGVGQNMYQNIAMSPYMTPGAAAATDQENQYSQGLADQTRGNAYNALSQGMQQMGEFGGVSSGSRERMTGQANKKMQDIFAQMQQESQMRKLGIKTEAGNEKLGMMKNIMGIEAAERMGATELSFLQEESNKNWFERNLG